MNRRGKEIADHLDDVRKFIDYNNVDLDEIIC